MGALISALMAATGMDKALASLIVTGALILAVAGLVALHQWRVSEALDAATEVGRVEERATWLEASAKERLRQSEAAARAIAEGQATAAEIARERDALAAQIEEISHAVDADPDGGRDCLDAGSVRALDALRRR